MMSSSRQLSFLKSSLSMESVREGSRAIMGDTPARWGLGVMIILISSLIGLAWFVSSRVPPEIPLHFSRPWGTKQLVSHQSIWRLTGTASLISILQGIFASFLFQRDKHLARLVVWTTCLVLFLLIVAITTVYIRVGS